MLAIIVGKADKKDIKSHYTTVSWFFSGPSEEEQMGCDTCYPSSYSDHFLANLKTKICSTEK
jgi:hypothetical protein